MRVWWIRRDLRLADNPALLAAADGDRVVPLFVRDPALWDPAGAARRTWLVSSLRALDAELGGRLVVRTGDPARVVPALAAEVGAGSVHVTADAGPYGRRRDTAVAGALREAGRRLVATGTPYAIGPGVLLTGRGTPYTVFTPFFRAWLRHGVPAPAPRPDGVRWATGVDTDPLPDPDGTGTDSPGTDGPGQLPTAGERAASARWREFLDDGIDRYAQTRDLPAVAGTSNLSAHLKFGELHPRTLLADLDRRPGTDGVQAFRRELAWREFGADLLWHRPEAAREDLRPVPGGPPPGPVEDRLAAWQQGRTGFPLVDAGMRHLLTEGWLPNRVRMVTAGFLVKDLHLPWQVGARWFLQRLRDGDLASNSLNWQWCAGTGTDAAPYFRILNPVTQGLRFDPDGEYVRRYVPELAHLVGSAAHTPWEAVDGYAQGYPPRIVDHATERALALARLNGPSPSPG